MLLINSITICPENITVTKGKWYYGACAEICPTNATCKCLTWHSSNSNVASVNQSGYICGVSEGVAVIYATAQDGSGAVGFCNVTVVAPIKVNSVTVTPSIKSVTVGDTFALSATVRPDNAEDKRIRWTSSDYNIADVDSVTGCVTAKAAGTTYICANAQDGSGASGYCEVTVSVPVVEDTVPGLKTIKQCKIRKEMSMNDSAVLKNSNGLDVKLEVGDTVPLLSTSTISANGRIWYRILYNGMMLHVAADDNSFESIAVAPPTAPNGTSVYVNTGDDDIPLRLRCVPNTNNDTSIIGRFTNGATAMITNETPQNDIWYAVYGQLNDGSYSYGWCSGEYLGNDVEYGTLVDVDVLNVRAGAGTNYSILGTISRGTTVEILEKSCATGSGYVWHKILYNGSVAYVIAGNDTPNFTFETRWVALVGENSSEGYNGNYTAFLEVLGFRESSGNYSAISPSGSYLGRYQMGHTALVEAGFKDTNGNWTSLAASYGVTSNATFLSSPNAQEYAIRQYHKKIWGYLKHYGAEELIGQIYYNVIITESGLLAAAHLVGANGVITAIQNNTNIEDGLGTPAYEYMSLMKNYDISEIK